MRDFSVSQKQRELNGTTAALYDSLDIPQLNQYIDGSGIPGT
jgi:hypothetical protein